jgi:hypothetical protein
MKRQTLGSVFYSNFIWVRKILTISKRTVSVDVYVYLFSSLMMYEILKDLEQDPNRHSECGSCAGSSKSN